MPDLTLSVSISRTLLSLGALELNDHTNFYLSSYEPGPVSYVANRVSGPYTDDDFTVNRRLGKVNENYVLEVLDGGVETQAGLQANLATAMAAFKQLSYTLTFTVNGTAYAWTAETQSMQVKWNGPRMVARQVQLVLNLERSPTPVSGPF